MVHFLKVIQNLGLCFYFVFKFLIQIWPSPSYKPAKYDFKFTLYLTLLKYLLFIILPKV